MTEVEAKQFFFLALADEKTVNSLEELQHSRNHLRYGLHGEELVAVWRDNRRPLSRNRVAVWSPLIIRR